MILLKDEKTYENRTYEITLTQKTYEKQTYEITLTQKTYEKRTYEITLTQKIMNFKTYEITLTQLLFWSYSNITQMKLLLLLLITELPISLVGGPKKRQIFYDVIIGLSLRGRPIITL